MARSARHALLFLIAVALAGGLVAFLNLRAPGVVEPEQRPAVYQALVDSLERRATRAGGPDYLMLKKPPEGKLGQAMENLGVDCLLYVHERWNALQQRGVVVAGEVPNWWGGARVRAYKLAGGRLEPWPSEERPRGPMIYNWRNPMEGDWCTHSG